MWANPNILPPAFPSQPVLLRPLFPSEPVLVQVWPVSVRAFVSFSAGFGQFFSDLLRALVSFSARFGQL
jgi:hypothetical protein